MTVSEAQLRNIGRNIDRLVTVEARISDYARDVIAKLYQAACEAQGGGPLSLLAAHHILAHARPGQTVFIATGAGDPRFMPAGETDGPPGAAALALAIHGATGAVPILLTEPEFISNLGATALAAGLGLRDPELALTTPYTAAVLPLAGDDTAESQAGRYLDRFRPGLLIAIEKLGPNPDGVAQRAVPSGGRRSKRNSCPEGIARRRRRRRFRTKLASARLAAPDTVQVMRGAGGRALQAQGGLRL